MSRPRANLNMRFADAVARWEEVLENNGLILDFDTPNEAIAATYRLNKFRSEYRKTLGDEMSVYDRFNISLPRGTLSVTISPRRAIAARSVRTLDGKELETIAIEQPTQPLQLDED